MKYGNTAFFNIYGRNLPNILFILLIFCILQSCNSIKIKKEKIDFSSYSDTYVRPAANQKRANAFLEIYSTYGTRADFEKQLLRFLKHQNNVSMYHDISWFLNKKSGYTPIDNIPLAEKVLLQGINRIKGDDIEARGGKCMLLWDMTYLFYSTNQMEKALTWARKILNQPVDNENDYSCSDMPPALHDGKSTEAFHSFVMSAKSK